jgi:hypothetical protein
LRNIEHPSARGQQEFYQVFRHCEKGVKATPEFLDDVIVPELDPDCNACAVAIEIYDGESGTRHMPKILIRDNLSALALKLIRKWCRMFKANSKIIPPGLLGKQLAGLLVACPTHVPAENYNAPSRRYPPAHIRIDLFGGAVNFRGRRPMVRDIARC